MDPRRPATPALDYSSPDSWMRSHAALSDALGAIAFAQPLVGMLSLRWAFGQSAPTLLVDAPRRARRPTAEIALDQATAEALCAALPGLAPPEALDLSEQLALAAPLARACSDAPLAWATRWEHDSLGLGCSARFDTAFPDGIDRDAPEGSAEAERVFSGLADLCPRLASQALLCGARQLSGSAQEACEQLLALFEADAIDGEAAPAKDAPAHGAPGGRIGRRL